MTENPDKNELYYATSTEELEKNERVIVEVAGREVSIFNVDGELYALLNFCIHQGGPVCEGRVRGELIEDEDGRLAYDRENEIVVCPWHYWEFDIKTGSHLARPDEFTIPTYDVVIEDENVFVAL